MYTPVEIVCTGLCHAVLEDTHGKHDLLLDRVRADDVVVRQEVSGHRLQRLLWPATEPVHGAARDQAGKLQRSVPELLTNLKVAKNKKS